jgi:predicted GNAT superfamily acetyltransferase
MLGVLPEYQNSGLGRKLKLAQRDEALQRSIKLIEWTFDPLEIKNAYFNMERLGAIVRRYVENQYGTTSSPLHGGLPTDRCTAEWLVASDRVKSILAGEPPDRSAVEERIERWDQLSFLKSREVIEQLERIEKDMDDKMWAFFKQHDSAFYDASFPDPDKFWNYIVSEHKKINITWI